MAKTAKKTVPQKKKVYRHVFESFDLLGIELVHDTNEVELEMSTYKPRRKVVVRMPEDWFDEIARLVKKQQRERTLKKRTRKT